MAKESGNPLEQARGVKEKKKKQKHSDDTLAEISTPDMHKQKDKQLEEGDSPWHRHKKLKRETKESSSTERKIKINDSWNSLPAKQQKLDNRKRCGEDSSSSDSEQDKKSHMVTTTPETKVAAKRECSSDSDSSSESDTAARKTRSTAAKNVKAAATLAAKTLKSQAASKKESSSHSDSVISDISVTDSINNLIHLHRHYCILVTDVMPDFTYC